MTTESAGGTGGANGVTSAAGATVMQPPTSADQGTAGQPIQAPGAAAGTTNQDPNAPMEPPFSTDRAGFFGQSRCASSHFALCEDFESGTLDPTVWTVEGTVSPSIGDARAARGSRALHILLAEASHNTSFITQTKTFPALADGYFVRVFVYFAVLPIDAPAGDLNWAIAASKGSGAPGEATVDGRFTIPSGKTLFKIGNDQSHDTTGSGTWYSVDNDPKDEARSIPVGEWMCIEWQHLKAASETRFFWDGAEHPSMHSTSTMNPGNGAPYVMPSFESMWLGWKLYQSSAGSVDLWLDEIAVDQARIGCVR